MFSLSTSTILLSLTIVTANKTEMEPRIIGGQFASINDFPHSVFLEVDCGDGDAWGCGASVLNQRIVLTAAHCVDLENKGEILAVAGHHNIEKSKTIIKVIRYTMHKNYDKRISNNDIALGYLRTNLPLGRNIQRIPLPRVFPVVGKSEKLLVAGWGTVSDDVIEASLVLKSVDQTLKTRTFCGKIVEHLKNGMMCASKNVANRPAHGDSGSALVTSHKIQIGLVSFRTRTVAEVLVYMNVSYYYNWIRTESRKLRCNLK